MTTFRSFAKINLHLQVVGRRSDGYHELRTVFQTVDLHDEIELELAGDEITLDVEGDAPGGEENLVLRAARAFADRWPFGGAKIGLRKRIPSGGGLGGGSSNAATTLLGLRRLTGVPATPGELWSLARELGADVPYFLVGGTALGTGRGDEVTPIPELPETELWLITPDRHVSTPEIFRALDLTRCADHLEPAVAAWLVRGGEPLWEELVGTNDLENPVFERFPEIRRVCDNLCSTGGTGARLSGSGATLFCRVTRENRRERIGDPLGEVDLKLCCRTRTLSRNAIAGSFMI